MVITLIALLIIALAGYFFFDKRIQSYKNDIQITLRPLRLITFLTVAGAAALLLVPQGKEMIRALSEQLDSFDNVRFTDIIAHLLTLAAILYWSFMNFWGASLILHTTTLRAEYLKAYRMAQVKKLTPTIFGLLPICIAIFSFGTNGFDLLFIPALIAAGGLLWFYYKNHQLSQFEVQNKEQLKQAELPSIELAKLDRPNELYLTGREVSKFYSYKKYLFWILWAPFWAIIISVLTTFYNGLETLQLIGPTAIVCFGFGAWVCLSIFIVRWEHRTKWPLSILLVLWIIVISPFNNNHTIRTSDTPIDDFPRLSIKEHFKKWAHQREFTNDSISHPIYIVAAEGGGIKAAYYTSGILNKLCDSIPEFEEHIFCTSSVSGGTLGAAAFLAERNNGQSTTPDSSLYVQATEFLKADFLTGVTASLVFSDMFQRFIPYPFETLDRSRALEYSWENSWNNSITHSPNTFSKGFAEMFCDTNNIKPIVIFNSLNVETGRRAIVSNVNVSSKETDGIDLLEKIGEDIPLSTACLLSARFPFICPAGKIVPAGSDETWGHIVDGGYYENVGLLSVHEVLKEINSVIEEDPDFTNLVPHLIIIRSSEKEEKMDEEHSEAHEFFNEATEVPVAVINRIFKGSVNYAMRVAREESDHHRTEFVLEKTSKEVPLGWYLSERATQIIDDKITSDVARDSSNHASKLSSLELTLNRPFIDPADSSGSMDSKSKVIVDDKEYLAWKENQKKETVKPVVYETETSSESDDEIVVVSDTLSETTLQHEDKGPKKSTTKHNGIDMKYAMYLLEERTPNSLTKLIIWSAQNREYSFLSGICAPDDQINDWAWKLCNVTPEWEPEFIQWYSNATIKQIKRKGDNEAIVILKYGPYGNLRAKLWFEIIDGEWRLTEH